MASSRTASTAAPKQPEAEPEIKHVEVEETQAAAAPATVPMNQVDVAETQAAAAPATVPVKQAEVEETQATAALAIVPMAAEASARVLSPVRKTTVTVEASSSPGQAMKAKASTDASTAGTVVECTAEVRSENGKDSASAVASTRVLLEEAPAATSCLPPGGLLESFERDMEAQLFQESMNAEREANHRAAEAEARASALESILAKVIKGQPGSADPDLSSMIADMLRRPPTTELDRLATSEAGDATVDQAPSSAQAPAVPSSANSIQAVAPAVPSSGNSIQAVGATVDQAAAVPKLAPAVPSSANSSQDGRFGLVTQAGINQLFQGGRKMNQARAVPSSANSEAPAVPSSANSEAPAVLNSANSQAPAVPSSANSQVPAIPSSANSQALAVPSSANSGAPAVPSSANSDQAKASQAAAVPTNPNATFEAPEKASGSKDSFCKYGHV